MTKNQKIQRTRLSRIAAVFAVVLVVIGVLLGVYIQTKYVQRYNEAADLASTIALRELILQGVADTKVNAPVEARTGDIYFPQARLYLPDNPSATRLTYAYDSSEEFGGALSISNKYVFSQVAAQLHGARDMKELSRAVPKLQACQRGVKLLSKQVPASESLGELKDTVTTRNGVTWYAYIESACPELNETLLLLKNIQSY